MTSKMTVLPLADSGKVWKPVDPAIRRANAIAEMKVDVLHLGKMLRLEIIKWCAPAIPLLAFVVVAWLMGSVYLVMIAGGLILVGAALGAKLYGKVIRNYLVLKENLRQMELKG